VKRIWVILVLASAVRGADVTLLMTGQTTVPNFVRIAATDQATRMFAGIGVRLESKKQNLQSRSEGRVIQVRFIDDTPGHPGVMAFSNPFDPVPLVTVLYDRILFATERNPERRAALLAHVLVHEIGHVLMRTHAHSPDGVMKAHWSNADQTRMAYRPLPFLPHEVDLILRGLALRPAAPVLKPPAVQDADSFRVIPLKAAEGSGMRIGRLAMVLVAAAAAWEQDQEVTVHLVKGELVPLTVLLQAERTATWLYAGIGVKLKWSSSGKGGLSMQFDAGLPEGFHPGALGYAMPFAQTGTRIHVLVDRLHVLVTKPPGGALLGHVLAHELAHVLEGFTHHSEAGVMKARWDHGDLEQMARRPLSFSAEDAAAIRSGLAKILARSTGSPVDLAERQ
jgi:hypothetical protein